MEYTVINKLKRRVLVSEVLGRVLKYLLQVTIQIVVSLRITIKILCHLLNADNLIYYLQNQIASFNLSHFMFTILDSPKSWCQMHVIDSAYTRAARSVHILLLVREAHLDNKGYFPM